MNTDFVSNTPYLVPIITSLQPQDAVDISARVQDSVHAPSRVICASTSTWALSRTRRVLDMIAATIALTAFIPIMGLVAITVRLSSPGPILFKQERMGRNGCTFILYKFRSMRVIVDHSCPITVTGDDRITKVGKFLRKYKLDELPQFWNVLLGDMGLVGPRPKLPHHEALHMPFRPGITGAATLAFRYEEEMLSQIPREHLDAYYERYVKPSKAHIDWEYMQSATAKTDFGILLQTAKSCCSNVETSYRVQLPEYSAMMQDFFLDKTGTDSEPSFRASII